jgi:hypothetical protein
MKSSLGDNTLCFQSFNTIQTSAQLLRQLAIEIDPYNTSATARATAKHSSDCVALDQQCYIKGEGSGDMQS